MLHKRIHVHANLADGDDAPGGKCPSVELHGLGGGGGEHGECPFLCQTVWP